jgi:DNA-directed RNA polymerase subunit RPC12/RpoP
MTIDWRLERLLDQEYLHGVKFHRAPYRQYRPGWDHDHCAGCWAKFAEYDSDQEVIEHEGYTTGDDYVHGAEYWWVCLTCFSEFKEAMGWPEV